MIKNSGNSKTLLILTLTIFSFYIYPQEKFSSGLFNAELNNSSISVFDLKGNQVYTKHFQNPSAYLSDLDNDGVDEFLIRDKTQAEYFLYIYNLLDTFYLTDEINSGVMEPYEIFLEEIEGLTIIAGNSDFSYLNDGSEIKMLPVNCWKFEEGEIFLVNDEIYDFFISENENLLSLIDSLNIKDCLRSNQFKSLLASVYINYLSAGEKASAENFLNMFYLCDNLENFKEELNKLFYKGE